MWLFCSSLHSTVQVYIVLVRHTINHVDEYYAFPSHFWLNMCSAGDNYAHAQTVDTRLFFSPPTKSLGTRLVYMYLGRQRKGGTLDRKNTFCIASFPGPAQLSAAWCTKKRQTLSFRFFVHVWGEERGYMFFALDSAEEPRNKASTLQVQTFMYLAFSQASHIFVHGFAFSIIHRNGRAAKKQRRPRSN